MKKGQDIAARFTGLFLVHHNKPDMRLPAHAHDEHHLLIPLRGEIDVVIEDKRLNCGPGKMVYVPESIPHAFEATNAKEGERIIALIDAPLWRRLAHYRGAATTAPAHQLVKELIFFLLLNPKTSATPSLVRTLIETVSETLAAAETGTNEAEPEHWTGRARDPRVRAAVTEIERRYSEDLRVEELAKHAGLSARNLSRLFVEEIGCGPKDLITRFRVAEARRLLLAGRSVTETAFEVGYGSLSRFIEAFRSLTGQLPSDYRG